VEQELNPHIKAFAIGRGRGLNNKSGRGRSTGGRTQSNGSYPFLHQPWPNSSQVNFCPGTTRLPSSNHFRPPSQFPMTSFGNRQTPYPRNTISDHRGKQAMEIAKLNRHTRCNSCGELGHWWQECYNDSTRSQSRAYYAYNQSQQSVHSSFQPSLYDESSYHQDYSNQDQLPFI
jgi:hypothetical protein